MVHDDQQPLGCDLAVGAPELGHVGVHGQFLAGEQDVGVADRRLDDVATVQAAGGVEHVLVGHERLDPRRQHFVAVGVRLPEVVGAGRHQASVGVLAAEAATGADKVDGRVIALGQLGRERRGVPLVAVEAVAREAPP